MLIPVTTMEQVTLQTRPCGKRTRVKGDFLKGILLRKTSWERPKKIYYKQLGHQSHTSQRTSQILYREAKCFYKWTKVGGCAKNVTAYTYSKWIFLRASRRLRALSSEN
jgi:hypothetical protein